MDSSPYSVLRDSSFRPSPGRRRCYEHLSSLVIGKGPPCLGLGPPTFPPHTPHDSPQKDWGESCSFEVELDSPLSGGLDPGLQTGVGTAHCQHTFSFGLLRFKHMQIRVNAEPAAFFR